MTPAVAQNVYGGLALTCLRSDIFMCNLYSLFLIRARVLP